MKKTITKKKPVAKKNVKTKTDKKEEHGARNVCIVIPMAGTGKKFKEAGYSFPKPLIDIGGKTMIELVTDNIRPKKGDYRFVFVCQRDHYMTYDLHNVLKNASQGKFDVVPIIGQTKGAACTVLCGIQHIDNDDELIIANSDQLIDFNMDDFLVTARKNDADGLILTFTSNHPKWSYVRVNASGLALETAEKKVISDRATAGIYYFKHGSDFVRAAQNMIHKDIHHNNEFYVCPVFNELILQNKKVHIYHIDASKMHGLGTPEEVRNFLEKKK
jgi:NDP-sugar pyrophosphorylase family protein